MRKFLFLLFFTALVQSMMAQDGGVISGTVAEESSKRTLPGAFLALDKLNRYTVSDKNGYFEFLNVPAGNYKITVSYLGYCPALQDVTVKAGENTKLVFEMVEDVQVLDEVVVMGDMIRGQAKAFNQQKTNKNITNVISSDQVGRFPDANIGDALKRVPGITMQNDQGEARNIIIRGLSSELNSVTLNGSRIPSAEGDNRKVQMDLIPSDMIQTIQVNKTLTPDMDGDAIGGSVDLVTRAASGAQRISITAYGGYNPIRDGATGAGSLVYSNRFANGKVGVVLSASYMNKDYGSDNIEGVWTEDDNGNVYLEEMDIRKYDVQRIRRSIALNTDWKINDNNTIAFDAMYNWRDDRENRYRTTYQDIEPVYGSDGSITGYTGGISRETKGGIDDRRNKKRRLEDQRVQSYALTGTHLISPKFDLDWNFSYAKASEDRPHERYIEYVQEGLSMTQNLSDPYKPYILASGQDPAQFVFDKLTEQHDYTDEDEYAIKVNARIPLTAIADQKGRLHFGLRARIKSKDRNNNFYEYTPLAGLPPLSGMNTVIYDKHLVQGKHYVPGTFVSNKWLGNVDLYNGSEYEAEADPSEYLVSNYKANEQIYAGYLRWDQNITQHLMFIAGARVEHTRVDYKGAYSLNEEYDNTGMNKMENDYTNVLPSVTLMWNAGERMVVRGAFSTALARPNYYTLVPFADVKAEDREIQAGNPGLKATYSYNVDLIGEYYFKSVGILSAGLFYKNLNNFIYNYLDASYTTDKFVADFPDLPNPIPMDEQWRMVRPLNGDNVDLFGFEVALQRKFDFFNSKFLSNFNAMLNYTYTYSRTKGVYNEDGEERTDVKLPGTAPHMFNASLAWENRRFSARVSLNYTGGYIDEVGGDPFEDHYYDHQLFLDANASYLIGKGIRIFAEANNLTNQPLRYYQGVRSRMAQLEYYQGTFNLGVKWDF